ncbi:S-layer homology domain-containing protein [Bacillus sp. REN10]|uniref:S-layer homology domain-containing protein n=1 Tax=Bacillus sp. REN10 TaxID=2782541 RepID=UPI00193B2B56|nr:S-layer homology domain-containing protein [Bacillus sp. REN10]
MKKKRNWQKVSPVLLAATLSVSGILIPASNVSHVQAQEAISVHAEQVATSFMTAVTNEKWDEAYALLNENLKKHMTQQDLARIWQAKTTAFGKIGKQISVKKVMNAVHTNIVMTYEGTAFPMEVTVNLDKEGRIDDFFIPFYYSPPSQYKKPTYEKEANYSEQQVKIGEGELALPGTLTIPKGKGPFPAIVLVHGSGPNDQDESFYSTRAFRDIAVGLANEGIAVLRYEKVTREHHLKTGMNSKFSIQEETIDDAVKAVQLLGDHPEVSDQIYVLGHSQGGYAMPRILEADKKKQIKGGIIVSGPSGKFQDLMLKQQQDGLERAKEQDLPPEQLEAAKANLAFWEQQIALINNPAYSKDHIPKEFQLPNAYWWFELRDYVPTQLAIKQNVPLLIMQGGKDLQVPPSDLDGWKNALAKRKNVDYKMYPDLIHLLVNYKGEPDFSEYAIPANVPEEFIKDINNWVKGEKESLAFKDVTPDFWAYKEIQFIAEKGYINGYKDGSFQPNKVVTRAHAAKLLANALNFDRKLVKDSTEFKDVASDNEFLPYIRFLKQNGVLSGFKDGTFRPNDELTRSQLAKLLSIAFDLKGQPTKPFKDVSKNYWAAPYIDALAANGITVGNFNGTFGPNQKVTRAQAAVFLYRVVQ